MGHKVNPVGLRLGINRTWDSRWYADKDYAQLLHADVQLRAHLKKNRKLQGAGVARVVIDEFGAPRVTISVTKLGVLREAKRVGVRLERSKS